MIVTFFWVFVGTQVSLTVGVVAVLISDVLVSRSRPR